MTSFRITALTVISAACILGAASTAVAQSPAAAQRFARCPQSPTQFAEVMKHLVGDAARARVLADENPLLEPDAAFYEAELAATRRCVPAVASLSPAR